MSKILLTSLRDVRHRVLGLRDRIDAFRFGLSLISEKRKNYYFNVFLVSSSALTSGLYLSYNTIFIDRFKEVVHSYSKADLTPIDTDLQTLAQNVWHECNQRLHKSSDLLQFFPSVGSEPITIGSIGLPTGAVIGLPFNFTYNTTEDVKTVDLRFLGKHEPYMRWRSPEGQQLIQSFVLTEDEKRFAIARQIHLANNANLFIGGLNVGLSTAVGLGLAQVLMSSLKTRTKFFKELKGVGPQLAFRSLSLVFGFYLWTKLNEIHNYYSLLRADKQTVWLNDHYLESAVEYYNKLKKRNSCFCLLMKDIKTVRVFTEEGEVKGWLTAYILTLERRINYLNSLKYNK